MGVVHHANYLNYMEDGRTRFMADSGCSYAELESTGIGLPVRRAELRYWSPAHYDEELLVLTSIKQMRSASISFDYEIRSIARDQRVATGVVELACIDLRSPERKITALPQRLRDLFDS
ncbi:MAG: acyl-CoA thioester hydrolase [Planctomycetota bacterium]|jgi:acyl-CoA thioester hydrolase